MDATRYPTSKQSREIAEFAGNNWKMELYEALGADRYELMAKARKTAVNMANVDWISIHPAIKRKRGA